jgi:triose/dihydroxyacetone kinase / FAD-AMP lyase (cyclizing)
MLDAVACGAIFASPNVLQIEKGLQLVASPRGTLVIVKNYTGDKLNFGLAVEKTRVITGNNVNIVMVADDVSIRRANIKMVGRRGLAGIVLVHKIAGAAAAAGMSLQEVTEVSQYVAQNLVTIGVGLNRCDVPGQHHMDFIADEIELGMGIHNEPGSRKLTPQPPTPELIKEMLSALLNPNDKERNYLGRFHGAGSTEAVLLVNNLGGLSVLELTSLTGMVIDQLQDDYSIRPRRVYSGTFLSALNGSGFSITILDLSLGNGEDKAGANRILSFLDAPTTATGWSPSINSDAWDTTPEAKVLTAGGVEYHSKSELERIECNVLKNETNYLR